MILTLMPDAARRLELRSGMLVNQINGKHLKYKCSQCQVSS
jgi:hypothetical protein